MSLIASGLSPLACPRCKRSLPQEIFNLGRLSPCDGCKAEIEVRAFPALFSPLPAGERGERLVVDEEASCFYHQAKKAVRVCASCGRFLCGLCDLPLGDQHLCPTCLEVGREKGKLQDLASTRVIYPDIALALAAGPVLIFPLIYLSFLSAPAALFVGIRYRNAPSSLVRGSGRLTMAVARILAVLEIVGWIAVVIMIFKGAHS